MNIDKIILNELSQQAQTSPRLRCNLDLRNSPEDMSQRMLNALEPGTEVSFAGITETRSYGCEEV